MKKKLIATLLIAAAATAGAFAIAGCNVIDSDNHTQHSFTNYVSDNNATCTTDGTETAKCDGCEKTDTRIIADSKLNHNFVDYWTNNDATCTTDGTKTAKCSRYGCNQTNTIIDEGSIKDHHVVFTEWSEFDCVKGITITAYCDECEQTIISHDTSNAYGSHDFELTYYSDNNATCTEDGTKSANCKRCKAKDIIADIGSAGHRCYNYTNNYDETCTEDGTESGVCIRCDKTLTRVIENTAKGHYVSRYFSNGDYTCTEDGTESGTCLNCGETITRTEEGSAGHIFLYDNYVYNNATCTGYGTITVKCSMCEETKNSIDHNKKPLGHSFVSYISDGNATCTVDGTKTAKCERCEVLNTIDDTGSRLNHIYQKGLCKDCGTASIQLKLIDNSYYSVTGPTDSAPTEIFIIDTYNNLPIKAIEAEAFKNCYELTSITLPDSLTRISTDAFQNCPIKTATIPAIACKAIKNNNIKTVEITSGDIGNYAFGSCVGLTNVVMGDGVTSIGDSAFYNCSGLTSIIISDSVTSIGDSAFYGCSGLTSITIPDSVASIGAETFSGCNKIIEIENSVRYVDKWIIDCNKSVTQLLQLRSDTKGIACIAFQECIDLTSILIPDGVKSIGTRAFSGCKSLTSIIIPNSVKFIGGGAFYLCSKLISINIPDGVTSIEGLTFWECDGLTSVVIPDSVTSIGDEAFRGCDGITSITIPDSVTSIGRGAFEWIGGLSIIHIGRGVTSIGFQAFYGCSLTNITVDNNNSAYKSENNCLLSKDGKILILSGRNNSNIPDGVTHIDKYAFRGNKATSLNIPDGVITIGEYAFDVCISLKTVSISSSVVSISEYAFQGINGLEKIIFSGTKDQWVRINKEANWDAATGEYTVQCTDGNLDKNGDEIE